MPALVHKNISKGVWVADGVPECVAEGVLVELGVKVGEGVVRLVCI